MKTRAITLSLATALTVGLIVAAPVAAADSEGQATFYTDFVADFERAGERLVLLAEAMPAETFSWSPAEGVRTVSEVFMHVAGVNMMLPTGLGAAPPEGMEQPENPMTLLQDLEGNVTAKDQVIDKLQDSIDYAAAAVPSITDLETEVDLFGFPGTKRAYLFILLTHTHEHLGQAIAYARSNGVVPPWSQ
ncbi:MAG: DinB family protein [Acidobacteriota bacterium]